MKPTTGLEELDLVNDHETIYLYDGQVVLHYSDLLHAYWVNDEEGQRVIVPSVTTVTSIIDKSGPLTQWAANSTTQYVLDNIEKAMYTPNGMSQSSPSNIYAKSVLSSIYSDIKNKVQLSADKVVTVLDCRQLAWLLNQARFNYKTISKDATDVGHEAHTWLEGYLKHLIHLGTFLIASSQDVEEKYCAMHPKPTEARAFNCVNAALQWLHRHRVSPAASERRIYSKEFSYSGTEDFEGYMNTCDDVSCCPIGGNQRISFIGDFKSSKAIYNEYRLQLAAYHQARIEESPDFGNDVKARIILRLGKDDGEFETLFVKPDEFDHDFDGFRAALGMYHWAKLYDLDKKDKKASAKLLKTATKKSYKKKTVIPSTLSDSISAASSLPTDGVIPVGE